MEKGRPPPRGKSEELPGRGCELIDGAEDHEDGDDGGQSNGGYFGLRRILQDPDVGLTGGRSEGGFEIAEHEHQSDRHNKPHYIVNGGGGAHGAWKKPGGVPQFFRKMTCRIGAN